MEKTNNDNNNNSVMYHLKEKCQHLEEKCQHLEEKWENLDKALLLAYETLDNRIKSEEKRRQDETNKLKRELQYHKYLIRQAKWEYSAEPIPESHWESSGHTEIEIGWGKSLVDQLHARAHEMRRGENDNGQICLCVDPPDEGEEGFGEPFDIPFSTDEELLIPHWKEFAGALHEYGPALSRFITDGFWDTSFTIVNIELSLEVAKLLQDAFGEHKQYIFKRIVLDNNGRRQSHAFHLAMELLGRCSNLEVIYFSKNDLDFDHLDCFCDAIQNIPSLKYVHIKDCCSRHWLGGFTLLRSLINRCPNVTSIDLSNNNIRTHGDTFLSDYLATNPPLESLYLGNNDFNDADVVAIANALKKNKNLKSLSIYNNFITQRGWDALRNTIFDQTNLNSVSDSNHNCVVGLGDINRYIPNNGIIGSPNESRQRKLYNVLSTRHRESSNVQHFKEDDFSPKIMPNIVGAVQTYSNYARTGSLDRNPDDAKPLSIVYEIMRYWEMPVLYQNRRLPVSKKKQKIL